jgi:dTDP-glucose pyrophosphorylase/CBS domain-containing protein
LGATPPGFLTALMDIADLCITPHTNIGNAIACIDRTQQGIALAVDEARRLIGTITDGDIRRALLAGHPMDSPVQNLLANKVGTPYERPISAPQGTGLDELRALMEAHSVRQIPLVDEKGKVVDLVVIDDLLPPSPLPMEAVIMAGGFGTRLRPLTDDLPKPMLPVGDKPLIEHIVRQLHTAGIKQVNIATHFMPEKIVEHFGDGRDFGVEINYLQEDRPLGTAGALGLMEVSDKPVLVINGDILTRVDFRSMLRFHYKHQADLTIGVRKYGLKIPFGVVEVDDFQVKKLVEKPNMSFFVNAGIYLLAPTIRKFIPDQAPLNMTDLAERLLEAGQSVVSFPIIEYWLDIGQHDDYRQAQQDIEDGRVS